MHISTLINWNGTSGKLKGEIAEADFAARADLLVRQTISAGLSRKWSAIILDPRQLSFVVNVGAIQDSRFSFWKEKGREL